MENENKPATALPPGTQPVPVSLRIFATVFDFILGIAIGSVVFALLQILMTALELGGGETTGPIIGGTAVAVLSFLASLISFAKTGWMPGALAVGYQEVRERSGEPPGVRGAMKHLLSAIGIIATAGLLGLAMAYSVRANPEGRGFHDRWAGVVAIRVGGPARGQNYRPPAEDSMPESTATRQAIEDALATLPEQPAETPAQDEPVIIKIGAGDGDPAPAAPSYAPSSEENPANTRAAQKAKREAADSVIPARPANPTWEPLEEIVAGETIPWNYVVRAGENSEGDYPRVGAASEESAGRRRLIRLDTGHALEVHGDGLVGRDPAVMPGYQGASLIPVIDDDRSISKTHLGFRPRVGNMLIEDMHSTNGTFVIDVDGNRIDVLPGQRVSAQVGSFVHFGDRFFRIEQ